MLDWVNTKPDFLAQPIAKLPLDTSQLNTNSWFAGFAEGDASFQIRITEGKYRIVATSLELSQGRDDPELFQAYKPIMETIASFLLANLGVIHLSKFNRTPSRRTYAAKGGTGKQSLWRARSNSQAGSQIVVNYFTQFPLFTSKYKNRDFGKNKTKSTFRPVGSING
jgi:hypothetical protein